MSGLTVSLEIYHKCLTYDFLAILLNETQDEPQTNVRNPFSIFAHPLMRQPIKQSSPSLQRRSRFYNLTLTQPSMRLELSPIRVREEDFARSAGVSHDYSSFQTLQQQKLNRYFQLPQAWSKYVESPETVSVLFFIVDLFVGRLAHEKLIAAEEEKCVNIINLALRCLQEYGNVRVSSFSSQEAKKLFTENYTTNLQNLLGCFRNANQI